MTRPPKVIDGGTDVAPERSREPHEATAAHGPLTMDLAAFHPELAAIGVVIGVVGFVLAWRIDERAGPAASVLVAMILVGLDQAPSVLVVAIGLAAVVTVAPAPWAQGLRVSAVLVALLALQDPSAVAVLLLAAAGLGLVAMGARAKQDLAPLPSSALLGVALVGTFGGAPDTEAAVLGTAALVPVLYAALVARARPAPAAPAARFAPLLLAAWICVDGYRGRPAGLAAAGVALVVVLVATSAAAAARNPRVAAGGLVTVAFVASVGTARTIGLSARWSPVAVATSVAVGAFVAAAAALSERAGSRRMPGG